MVLFEGGTRGAECPEDSVREESGECKCAAIDCPSVECQGGQRPIQVKPADPETPGSCCARYECVPAGKRESNRMQCDAASNFAQGVVLFPLKTPEDRRSRVPRTACSPRMGNASARPARRSTANLDTVLFKWPLPSTARRPVAVALSTSVDRLVTFFFSFSPFPVTVIAKLKKKNAARFPTVEREILIMM